MNDRAAVGSWTPPDLAERLSDRSLDLEEQEFDCFDKQCVEDVVGRILAEPVQNLLVMEATGLDKVSQAEIVKAVRQLHEAMKTAFVEGL